MNEVEHLFIGLEVLVCFLVKCFRAFVHFVFHYYLHSDLCKVFSPIKEDLSFISDVSSACFYQLIILYSFMVLLYKTHF